MGVSVRKCQLWATVLQGILTNLGAAAGNRGMLVRNPSAAWRMIWPSLTFEIHKLSRLHTQSNSVSFQPKAFKLAILPPYHICLIFFSFCNFLPFNNLWCCTHSFLRIIVALAISIPHPKNVIETRIETSPKQSTTHEIRNTRTRWWCWISQMRRNTNANTTEDSNAASNTRIGNTDTHTHTHTSCILCSCGVNHESLLSAICCKRHRHQRQNDL